MKSEQGTGSCFRIKLRFPLPSDDQKTTVSQESESREEFGKDVHFGAIKENTQTYAKDDNPQEQPGVCEEDVTKTKKPICENGCSSQYGETPDSRKHDNPNSNVNIDLSTESSELIHQSDDKLPHKQDEKGHRCSAHIGIYRLSKSLADLLRTRDDPDHTGLELSLIGISRLHYYFQFKTQPKIQ